MVHVRTVDGKDEIFGNQGALFMNAMTWWDHTTGSVWSQAWGRSSKGPPKRTERGLRPGLTKKYEEKTRQTISAHIAHLKNKKPRGEFVIII